MRQYLHVTFADFLPLWPCWFSHSLHVCRMLEPKLSGRVRGRMGQKRMWQAQRLGVNPFFWSSPLVLLHSQTFSSPGSLLLGHSSWVTLFYHISNTKLVQVFGILNLWLQSVWWFINGSFGKGHSSFMIWFVGIKMCKSVFNPLQLWIVLFLSYTRFYYYLKETWGIVPDPAPVEH